MSEAENHKPLEIARSKKPSLKSKWLCTLLLLLVAVLTCLLYIEDFVNGMTNYGLSLFGWLGCWGEFALFLSVPAATLLCLVLLIVRLVRRSGGWGRDIVISIILLPAIFWGYTRPGYVPFTYGFRERMRRSADTPAIRSWLEETQFKPEEMSWRGLDPSDWPECIKKLEPQSVRLQDESSVRLRWGGGFGHWGMVVGPETMEIPPSDIEEHTGEYRVPFCAGGYVWHEIQ